MARRKIERKNKITKIPGREKRKATKTSKKRKKRIVGIHKRGGKSKALHKKSKIPSAPKETRKGFSLDQRLHHLLTETSVVIYASKPSEDYGAIFVSDNVKKITGYTYKSFVRKSNFWLDHVHPDDRERVLKEIPRLFKNGYYEYEYRFKHKNGNYIWVHDEMKLVYDDKGNPLEIVGYWTDVTKRRQMEEDIRRRAERIVNFMESATEGFVLMDSDFNVVEVNQYILDKFDVKIEDVRGVNVLDISTDLWESGRYEKYMEVLKTGKPCVFEDVIAPAKFGDKHLNLIAFRVGSDIGLIVQDITDQKRMEQRLKDSEERLRTLYDTINAGIIFEDVDGVVIRANRIATDILDLDEDELIGNNLIDTIGEVVDAQGIGFGEGEHPLMKTQATGEPVHNVILGLLPNDPIRKRWILINTEPIVDAVTGKLDEILVTFVDFTEQKQIEEALIESEERYRHMFEQCPIGVGISTLDGQVITANRAMQEITGYSLDEFRQINIADTYENVEDRRRLLQALNQYGRVTDYRVRLKRKDGKSYDAILNISRINLGGKDYLHTMCQPAASRKSK